MKAKQFTSFKAALRAMPSSVALNFDALTHTTLEDLAYCAEHELDLYYEGEPNEFKTKRQVESAKQFVRNCLGRDYK